MSACVFLTFSCSVPLPITATARPRGESSCHDSDRRSGLVDKTLASSRVGIPAASGGLRVEILWISQVNLCGDLLVPHPPSCVHASTRPSANRKDPATPVRIREKDKYVQNVGHLIAMWVERALKPWMHNDFLYKWMPHGRRWYKICDFVHSVSEELISKRRKVLEASQVDEKSTESKNPDKELEEPEKKCMMSFVDILLTAKDEDGKGMTPTEIRNEADTFLFEGFDTTTSALSWTLYSMARWPQHQKKVQEEVDAVLKGRSSDDILWEDLSCFPYTTACIKEAMRNFSTVPFIERETKEDVMIDGHNIPAGTFVAIQLWCLHHNPQVWDRPHDYIPERFLGDSALKMDPFQFVPFSAGPRNCIGQNFAMHELKIMVAKICHRFSLSLDPNHEVLRAPFATFKAEKDIKMFAAPRLH